MACTAMMCSLAVADTAVPVSVKSSRQLVDSFLTGKQQKDGNVRTRWPGRHRQLPLRYMCTLTDRAILRTYEIPP